MKYDSVGRQGDPVSRNLIIKNIMPNTSLTFRVTFLKERWHQRF